MIDAKKLFDAVRVIKGKPLTDEDVSRVHAVIDPQPFTGPRKTGPKGIALIKASEGLVLKAYPDPATGGDPWTIGFGTTAGVKKGMVITEAQAETMLAADLVSFETALNNLCPVMTQNQFDACMSLIYNIGQANFRDSTLRRLHNEGNYADAAAQFLRWTRAAGKEMPGLVKRRQAESTLYASTAL